MLEHVTHSRSLAHDYAGGMVSLPPELVRNQVEIEADFEALAAALPPVSGDAERVTQILTNLLSNAHKYTPPGGRITVTAGREAGRVRIDVHDTGIGLSPEDQARLFTKFFRAQHPIALKVGGTGLGLAITRSLVELHGGAIAVASVPGQGSTFSVTLPTAQEPARPVAGPAPGLGS